MGFLFEEYYALATRKNDSITRVHTIWYFNFNSPESQADSAPRLLFADFLERAGRLPNYIWISRYFSLSRCSSINNIIFADPPLSRLSFNSRHIFTLKLISVCFYINTLLHTLSNIQYILTKHNHSTSKPICFQFGGIKALNDRSTANNRGGSIIALCPSLECDDCFSE